MAGAAYVLDPVEVGVRDVTEGDGCSRGLLCRGRALRQLALDLTHEPILRDDRGVLVEKPGLGAATTAPERAGPVALEPRWTDSHLP